MLRSYIMAPLEICLVKEESAPILYYGTVGDLFGEGGECSDLILWHRWRSVW